MARKGKRKGKNAVPFCRCEKRNLPASQGDSNSEAKQYLDVLIPRLVIQSQDMLPSLVKCHAAACFCDRTHPNQV